MEIRRRVMAARFGGRRHGLLVRALGGAAAAVLVASGCSSGSGAMPSMPVAEDTTTTSVPEEPAMWVVSTGGNHTCAIEPDGTATCWGENTRGQIGDGTTTDRPTAVAVAIDEPVAEISASGSRHTCALTVSGRPMCWGQNVRGTIGDGTTTDRPTPVEVVGLPEPVRSIAAGGTHSCALLESGSVQCWGRNDFAQLGNGTLVDGTSPSRVLDLPVDVESLTVGGAHSCVLTSARGLVCWGLNRNGQIGNGTTNDGQAPVAVPSLQSGVASVSAGGFHTCAVTTAGGVQCWGSNEFGQLGDGTNQDRLEPVSVVGLASGVAAVSAGLHHTCALRTDGTVVCWGRNEHGEMGDGTTTMRLEPVAPGGLAGVRVVQVQAGGGQTCASTSDAGLWCWGQNRYFQVGDGASTDRTAPVKVG
jgi:alpha-tubulin suppressor-like RCC1 family protein